MIRLFSSLLNISKLKVGFFGNNSKLTCFVKRRSTIKEWQFHPKWLIVSIKLSKRVSLKSCLSCSSTFNVPRFRPTLTWAQKRRLQHLERLVSEDGELVDHPLPERRHPPGHLPALHGSWEMLQVLLPGKRVPVPGKGRYRRTEL